MHTVNRTFSIPADLDKDLHMFVKRRNMSRFVSDSLRKSLEERREKLLKEYAAANEDEGQKEVSRDYEGTVADGLGEGNEW